MLYEYSTSIHFSFDYAFRSKRNKIVQSPSKNQTISILGRARPISGVSQNAGMVCDFQRHAQCQNIHAEPIVTYPTMLCYMFLSPTNHTEIGYACLVDRLSQTLTSIEDLHDQKRIARFSSPSSGSHRNYPDQCSQSGRQIYSERTKCVQCAATTDSHRSVNTSVHPSRNGRTSRLGR
jgi:hypothetical protein